MKRHAYRSRAKIGNMTLEGYFIVMKWQVFDGLMDSNWCVIDILILFLYLYLEPDQSTKTF